jgi:hypothetical protein
MTVPATAATNESNGTHCGKQGEKTPLLSSICDKSESTNERSTSDDREGKGRNDTSTCLPKNQFPKSKSYQVTNSELDFIGKHNATHSYLS